MIKILHISTFLQGGAGKVLIDLSEHELRNGNQIWSAFTQEAVGDYANYPKYLEKINSLKIPVIPLKSTFSRELESISASSIQLANFLIKTRPDIIHCHAATPSLIAMLAVKEANEHIPIIQTMHGWGIFKNSKQEKQDISIINLIDQVVPISMSSVSLLHAKGMKNDRCSVIYNGIEENPKSKSNKDDQDIIEIKRLKKEGFFILGAVGTVDERKNQKIIIKAISEFPPDCKMILYVVGEGEAINSLSRLCQGLGLEKKVRFAGYKENAREFISCFDLLISASRSEGGPPICLMEAFAEGTTVLASDTPEHREAITDGRNGFLFANDDPMELKKAINKVYLNSKTEEVVARANRFYQEHFRFTETGKSYNRLYSNLLS